MDLTYDPVSGFNYDSAGNAYDSSGNFVMPANTPASLTSNTGKQDSGGIWGTLAGLANVGGSIASAVRGSSPQPASKAAPAAGPSSTVLIIGAIIVVAVLALLLGRK